MTRRREPVHGPDCPNARLVCRSRTDAGRFDGSGFRLYECFEECLSCGARTDLRIEPSSISLRTA